MGMNRGTEGHGRASCPGEALRQTGRYSSVLTRSKVIRLSITGLSSTTSTRERRGRSQVHQQGERARSWWGRRGERS